jgi:cell division protein FtsI/penicillin-binding protein 2
VVANGGRLPRPHLMKSIGGRAMNTDAPIALGFRPAVVETVRDAMVAVVNEGTGQRAKLDGVVVGGKTGSAQVVTHARLESNKDARAYQPHGWFMAFAPPTNGKPGVAVAVLVEHGVGGATSAAPVVGKALARYYGVPAIGPGMTPPPDVLPADPQPVRAHVVPRPPPLDERRAIHSGGAE